MTRRDVLLAALSNSADQSLTPVQIQKAMFLVAKEAGHLAPKPFYEFEKYNYGPFCADIYSDLDALRLTGFVSCEQMTGSRVRRYRLTAVGHAKSNSAGSKLNPVLGAYLQTVVRWVTSLGFQDLVRSIYKKYPEYKENSIFSD
jgi:hypothetical protein